MEIAIIQEYKFSYLACALAANSLKNCVMMINFARETPG